MKITKILSLVLVILCLFSVIKTYEKVNDRQQIMALYERYSFYPILHIYYNRHFSNSKQFQNFIEVIQDAQYKIGQYSKILFTDCEFDKKQQIYPCKQIKRLNENRMIIGQIPSNQFTNFGDKIMQSPPRNRVYDHHSDTYTVQQITHFINQMVPNFYKQISNTYQFDEFKKPKYSPKIIYATSQGQIPQVIKRLGVTFFQKFDMAYVQDLTQTVVNQLEIKKYPCLLVLKQNFSSDQLQIFNYGSHDFSQDQYFNIKKFLQKYALKQKRSDHVFHLIKPSKECSIITVDNKADLKQIFDRLQGWIFLSEGPQFTKLIQVKQKYGLYYYYVHFIKNTQSQQKLFLYNSRSNIKYIYDDSQVKYRLMNAQDFQSNSTLWLKKDYVILGVREQFGHICALVDQPLFAGLAQCFIIDQNYYNQVTQLIGVKFKYGFIVTSQKGTNKVRGNQITNDDFQAVYNLLEYSTRMKVKDVIDDFLDKPVKQITQDTILQQICSQPFKKCIIYFEQNNKDKTNKEYLQMQARNFVNQYKFFYVNLQCNKHIFEQIPQLEDKTNGLIAYHPRQNKYVLLKAKINRNVIKKFLKINNQQKKSLPFKQFFNGKLQLNGCNQKLKNEFQYKQKDNNQSQL